MKLLSQMTRVLDAMCACTIVALAASCTLSTNPSETFALDATDITSTGSEPTDRSRRTSSGSSAIDTAKAGHDSENDAGGATPAIDGSESSSQKTTDAAVEKGAATPGAPSNDASTSVVDASDSDATHAAADEVHCAAQLATCLLLDPLAYAECLRVNAQQGCMVADGFAPQVATNSRGEPLSTACQAQLADCITRNPTPQGAADCQAAADTCTL